MEVMLKIIELWLFRRLEQLRTLHRLLVEQQVQSRTIFQLVARFHLQVDSPSITQFSRKVLMHRIGLELQLLQTQVKQQHLLVLKTIKISELRMLMATFHPKIMRRTGTKNSNQRPVKVQHSLLKRQRTVQLATTSLVSAKELNVYLRNETLHKAAE